MNKKLLTDILSAIGRAKNSIYCFGRWLAEELPIISKFVEPPSHMGLTQRVTM